MNSMFVDILKQLIAEQGKEALLNNSKCKAFLADYTKGDYKKESRLLLQALDAGVQKEIDTATELELCKRQQVKVLQEEHFLSAEAAADIVDTLALVLKCEQESDTPQGAFCSKCGKELQKEWASCPYCGTPAAKIQHNPPKTEITTAEPPETKAPETEPVKTETPEAESPPVPLQETTPGALQSPSPTLTVQPPLNKKKHTKRNLIIAGVVLLLVISTIVGVIVDKGNERKRAQRYYDIGVSYYNNGDYDNAISWFTDAISLNENYTEAYFERGLVYWIKEQYDMAIKDFDNAIRLDPNHVLAYTLGGNIYLIKGQYDTAVKYFDNAIRLDPNNAFAYASRGQSYGELGQRDRAIQDLEKANSIDPNNEWAKERLKEIRGY